MFHCLRAKAFVTPSIDDLRSAMILNGAMVLGTHQ